MKEPKLSKFIECSWCKSGCGLFTYHCYSVLEGDYCSSDHYVLAMLEKLNIHYPKISKEKKL